ncbi:unnamed protein product [Adineta steineri]|uniref:RNA helicase n=1 Tax=Adineta steineri TaxID=433720 RepID=A0A818JVC7_9BILA|nr:unnamed protein product [Adineta steineri]CAF3551100.1 unnamed protein product [Adineta steineri]
MSDENLPEVSNENNNQESKEQIDTNVEQKLPTPTVSDMDDVQSFCAEFHIKVENAAGIRPWLQFSDTNFSEEVLKQFEECEFDMPTPIQSIAWPILNHDRDLVGIASTGSGKTLAFILPLVLHIRKQPPLQPDDGPIAIVLAPTRELVQQIHNVAQPYFNIFGIKSLCIIGGDEREKQINEIGDGKEVYICTPGRLADFLESKITTLYRVTFIVLDEADKMLDLGFEPQIRNILADFKAPKPLSNEEEEEEEQPPARRQAQISMFSATWPKSIKTLAEEYLTNYVHATVGCLSESHAVNLNIQQIVDFCPNEQQKKQNLFKILDEVCAYAPERKTIIFVRTRDKVNRLSKDLEQNGYKALLLHGSKSQQMRNEVLKEFRETQNALLLATDVASRGLDVDDVRFVINFDFPTSDAVYIHRIGRTGRSAQCGTAFTFFSNEDAKHAPALINILDEAGAVVHPIILQIGRKNGFNKWVANVGMPQYPVYNPDENWSDGNYNSQDWPNNEYDNNEDLPPTLMNIDLSSFDPSQLRPLPVSLLNSNGQLNELDVNTRIKNFQDYKQRCQLLERLSWEANGRNYPNNQNEYNNYDNNYNNNNRYNGGWSNPGSENQNGRNMNSYNNEWQNKNFDSNQKRSWDNTAPPSHNNNNNNNQWNGNNNGQTNYDQWKPSNQPQPQQQQQQQQLPPQQQQQQQQQPQDQQLSDLETNPAIIYAKASSEYHIQYNQYTTALQQAMAAQQAGTPITPQQQQYLITFQQQLQAKQQQLQVMQQAANLQQATILQAAALSAASQNAWNQPANNLQTNSSNDLTKSTANAQQNWMQQWVNAGYDASQIAAYQQWYTQMQTAASLAASTALSQPQAPSNSYNGMPFSSNNSNQHSTATISAPPTVSSSTANAAQRAYAAYSNRAPTS